MNKQALAFLTMFSLVLMLSVYYVTLPSDSATVSTDDSKNAQQTAKENTSQKNKDKKEPETKQDKAAALQEEINQKKETEINKNSQVVANKESKEKDKQDALATMEEIENEKKMQSSIVDALASDKINAAVEIKEQTCTINVFDQKDDKTMAATIMKTVNSITNNKYLIEVTFK